MRGFEPPRAEAHMVLNHTRIPVPPHPPLTKILRCAKIKAELIKEVIMAKCKSEKIGYPPTPQEEKKEVAKAYMEELKLGKYEFRPTEEEIEKARKEGGEKAVEELKKKYEELSRRATARLREAQRKEAVRGLEKALEKAAEKEEAKKEKLRKEIEKA